MRCTFFPLTIAFSLVAETDASPSQDGSWPRYAHDPALTSRSPLHGKITKPHVLWSYPTGGRELIVELVPSEGRHKLNFASEKPIDASIKETIHATGPLKLDLDGTGVLQRAHETFHERLAKILPNVKGLQRVAWDQTFTDQKICHLQLFAYDEGLSKPRLVWQTEPPEDTIFTPLDVIYDLDGDGLAEICVAAHYRLLIFDGATGRKKTELRYHQSRPYGWFGLADVDGDGKVEFITIGDFQSHIDVVNYDPKKPEAERLSVRWRRDIEQKIEERKKWPQVGPHPVVDVTSDSRPEIVLNLFNDSGDGEWHVNALNAATGELLFDLPKQYVQGTADLFGDKKAELFVIATDGSFVPPFGDIKLVDLRDKTPQVMWSSKNASWVCGDLPRLEPTWSTSASQGMRSVLLATNSAENSPSFLVTRRKADEKVSFLTSLTAMHVRTGKVEELWQADNLPGDLQVTALAPTDSGPGALVRLQVALGTQLSINGKRVEARVLQNDPLGVTLSSPIGARLRPGGPMNVIVEGAARQIFALEPPTRGTNSPRLLWKRPGRGMMDGSRSMGLLAADLAGNGGNEVIAAAEDASGRALLVAYRADGSTMWKAKFDHTPGAVPIWNVPALTFWWPGSFRAPKQTDLFVNTRRGYMHSDVGQLFDGRTGATIWRQEKAMITNQFSWGYAGIPSAIADLDHDGLDELISLYPVCFWVADGRTGRLTRGVELASQKNIPAWAAYGEAMIHDFTRQGAPEVLLDSPYILSLLDTNGTPIWNGAGRPAYPKPGESGNTTSIRHALIDLEGNGTFAVASAGYGDGVRAIDAQTGKVLWSLAAPSPTCARVVAADIDGRKGDELLYVAGSKLIAITGDRSSGKILWEWDGPSNLSMPAVADLYGDNSAEILLQSADGTLFCLGPGP